MIRALASLLLVAQVSTSTTGDTLESCQRQRQRFRIGAVMFRGELAKCQALRTIEAAAPPQSEAELERLSREIQEAPKPKAEAPVWIWPLVGVASIVSFAAGVLVAAKLK